MLVSVDLLDHSADLLSLEALAPEMRNAALVVLLIQTLCQAFNLIIQLMSPVIL